MWGRRDGDPEATVLTSRRPAHDEGFSPFVFLGLREEECWGAGAFPQRRRPGLVRGSQFLSERIPPPRNWLGRKGSQLCEGCCRGHKGCSVRRENKQSHTGLGLRNNGANTALSTTHSLPVVTLGAGALQAPEGQDGLDLKAAVGESKRRSGEPGALPPHPSPSQQDGTETASFPQKRPW